MQAKLHRLHQLHFTDEAVIVCCQKAVKLLVELQDRARATQTFVTNPVRYEYLPMDHRTDPDTLLKLNLGINVPVATMDAICQFLNHEQMNLVATSARDNPTIRYSIMGLVMRPSL